MYFTQAKIVKIGFNSVNEFGYNIFLTFEKTNLFLMENTQQQEKVSTWKKIKIVFATLLAIFIIILIFQNWNAISISLVFKTINTPLPVIIVIALVTGYIWGTFSSYGKMRRREDEIRSLQRRVIDLKDKKDKSPVN